MFSNYTIKKTIPRLIIAAIAINTSYWICGLAVDVSNLLGESVFNILKTLGTDHVLDGTSIIALFEIFTAGAAAATVTAGAGAGAAIAATAAGSAVVAAVGTQLLVGVLLMFLGAALGVALAILVAFAILAARQALIVILIVTSPIAFALYVLPGTKPIFDKWAKLFRTMLVFFPLFALLYGGSLIAASILIAASGDSSQAWQLRGVLLLTGFLAEFTPLFLTPWLIKNSTGMLGQIGSRLQQRGSALQRPLRKAAGSQLRGAGALASATAKARFAGANFNQGSRSGRALGRIQRGMGRRKALTEQYEARYQEAMSERALDDDTTREAHEATLASTKRTAANTATAEGHALGTNEVAGAVLASKEAEGRKKLAETQLDIAHQQTTEGLQLEQKAADQSMRAVQAGHDTTFEELKSAAGRNANTRVDAGVAQQIGDDAEALALLQQRQAGAKRVAEDQYAGELRANDAVAQFAGGIDPGGATRARAAATQQYFERLNQAVTQEKTLLTGTSHEQNMARVLDTALPIEARMASASMIAESGYMGGALELESRLRLEMEKHAAPIRAQIQSANPTASSVEVEKMVQDQLVTESAANPEIDFIRDLQQQYNKDVRSRPFAEGDSTRQALSRGVATRDLNNEFAYRITEKLKGGTLPELKIEEVKDMRALIEGRLSENIVDPSTGAVSTVAIRPTTDHVNGIINAVKSLNSSPTDRAKLKEDSRKEIEAILSDPRFGGIQLEE